MNIEFKLPAWNIEDLCGYHPITTFWDDFSIADHFGMNAIIDTYNRAFSEWKTDYKYLTELVMVLNHKSWQYYDQNEPLSRLYNILFEQAYQYAVANLKGDEIGYFYITTD